jgi:glycyl-tRNA synthetase
MPSDLMGKIVSLSRRRGFIFQSSEIYGGFGSCYDYGPIGVLLKNNVKNLWWKEMVLTRPDIVGLDSAILMSPKIWQASSHLTAGFADPLVECKKCHRRFRADHLVDKSKCPACGGELTPERKFNLMMQTFVGPIETEAAKTYLRAETCQGIYVNFENVKNTMRLKIPFGIAQTGKAFRNEITPGNFTFRTREFEQMEMQWFCQPDKIAQKGNYKNPQYWFDFWKDERTNWYVNLGIRKEKLKLKTHKKEELAHYARQACDIQYEFPWGIDELEGIHNRGDWDLSNHSKYSGKDLSYFDEKNKNKYIPYIIETSAGADRSTLMFLVDAYHEEEVRGEKRVVLKFDKKIAPIKVAVLPLARNKKEITTLAHKIYETLTPHFVCLYDESGSIGKMYRRQDEIGTPYCLTVDFDSLSDKKVTIRDRDTMKQERVSINDLVNFLSENLK